MEQTMNITDTQRYSVPARWSPVLHALHSTAWEAQDIAAADPGEIGRALKYAYDRIGHGEDGVRAAMEAVVQNTTFVSPVELATVADTFQVLYDDWNTPVQDYLDEHHGGIQVQWLNDEGRREIERGVCKDSETWIELENGVYVFIRPGYAVPTHTQKEEPAPDDTCIDGYPEHDFPPESDGGECHRCGAEAE
ncbi:hypothetical protein ACFZAM_31815 [Streptomyces sp. NPDC008079]|uniref:hypothetical protein n=1 Tax=Streptomyces sp. NPDC008079 TaxID=3364806 RepID=UPI0036E817A6